MEQAALRKIDNAGREDAILSASGVSKRFGGVQALDRVDFAVRRGQVHGLVGPNGAGKSTLVGALTGRVRPDTGEIRFDGRPVHFKRPRDAVRMGISLVPQELAVPSDLRVWELVTLGAEPRRAGLVSRSRARRAAAAALERVGAEFSLHARLGELSPSNQKTAVVAQSLHHRHAVVIFDEPTAGMNAEHAQHVLEVIHALRQQEVAVIYISHRFTEVQELCDTVTLMRDGRRIGGLAGAEIGVDALVRGLANEEHQTLAPPARSSGDGPVSGAERDDGQQDGEINPDATRLVLDRFSGARAHDVSLTARPGEVVGVTGLPGSGVEDVFAALSGRRPPRSGSATFGERRITSVREALRAGVGYLPPSRGMAALPDSTVGENIVLSRLAAVSRTGLLSRRATRRRAQPVAQRLGVPGLAKRMGTLSGGNQQKALLARLLFAGGRALVLDDPTVGVDVVARAAVHALVREFAREGRICVIGSSEAEELVELCDRVLVLRRGSVIAELAGERLTAGALVGAITGGDATGARQQEEASAA